MKDPWHFERRDFTAHVLSLLTEGPAGALSLFGPLLRDGSYSDGIAQAKLASSFGSPSPS